MNKIVKYIKMAAIFVSIVLTQPANAGEKPHQNTNIAADYQQQILYYVNQYRTRHHLSALKMNNNISSEAAKHSRDMASKTMPFGHNGYNGRIKRLYTKFGQCRGGAENVAYYRLGAKKLVDAWIASPGHRQNIVGNYNLTGIGIAYSKEGWAYYTQIFLRSDSQKIA